MAKPAAAKYLWEIPLSSNFQRKFKIEKFKVLFGTGLRNYGKAEK